MAIKDKEEPWQRHIAKSITFIVTKDCQLACKYCYLVDEIIAEGKKEKIEPKDDAELIQTRKYLALQLKALVARDIWDMSQYFQVWNETNEIVQRAVKLLQTGK